MTKDEALKLALEALENAEYGDYDKEELNQAITAIKEALAQPEQDGECKYCTHGCHACDARRQSNVLP
jgi:20S proteasome alpha/beta subunit